MKKTALFSVIILVLSLLLTACGEKQEIEYIKSQSAVLSYEREDTKVAMKALITLKNNEKRDIEFTVTGLFPELYEAGVVLYEKVSVTDKKGFAEKLTIPASSTVCLECTFRTTYAGGNAAANENGFFSPPESLEFEIVPEDTYGVGD